MLIVYSFPTFQAPYAGTHLAAALPKLCSTNAASDDSQTFLAKTLCAFTFHELSIVRDSSYISPGLGLNFARNS
jgi:hypothetical protein